MSTPVAIQTDEQKAAVFAMIVAFGLEPNDVARVALDAHRVVFTRYLRNADDQFYVADPALPRDEWEVASEEVVFEAWSREVS
jgi:hypothetical protein